MLQDALQIQQWVYLHWLHLIQCSKDVHLSFRIQGSILQWLHCISHFFGFPLLFHFIGFLILCAPRFKISGSTRLNNIIRILWISLHGKFSRTPGAFEIESENLNSQICLHKKYQTRSTQTQYHNQNQINHKAARNSENHTPSIMQTNENIECTNFYRKISFIYIYLSTIVK